MKKTILFVFLVPALLALGACCKKEKNEGTRYSIEQFYQNKRIGGGAFSTDDKKLLVHSDESGIFNIYEISIEDSSRKALTSSTESCFVIDYVPGTDEVLYSSDKGGNEISHIFLLRRDGTSTDLTPGEKEKAQYFEWTADKKGFYYLSNKRDPRFFDLYLMKVGEWTSSLVYENNEGFDISAISKDGKTIALVQAITSSENKLFIYELSSKNMKEVSQADKPGIYNPAGFTRDNTTLFYITDVDKEFQYIAQYNLADSARKVYFETNWDVMYTYDSENEKYKVIAINEDGKNKLIVKDNTTGQEVELPYVDGADIIGVDISPSEKMVRLTIGTSKSPNNIYVFNFETQELKQMTNTLNPEINQDDLVTAEVVRYPSFDGLEIPAIYYKPLTADRCNKVPAIVYVHGGPGGQSRFGYSAMIQYLVNHGYAVLAVNNRGSSGYGKTFYKMDDRNHGDKDLKDCIWGKKYLQTLEYIDTASIGILGGSYGGYMTMAAMTFAPDEFKVGVNLFGVTNWIRTARSIPPYWESFRKALYAELGDPYTEDSLRLFAISPLFHADKVKHPVMVLQGANDPRVLQVESDEIVAAIKKNNVPVEYIIFPDEGHGFIKKENEIKGYGEILTFLDKYLKPTGD